MEKDEIGVAQKKRRLSVRLLGSRERETKGNKAKIESQDKCIITTNGTRKWQYMQPKQCVGRDRRWSKEKRID